MLYFTVPLCEPFAHFFRLVFKRPHPAFVRDAPIFVDDIEPLGPGGIRIVRGVTHFINAERNPEFKSLREVIRDRHALLHGSWLRVANVVLFLLIALHLPLVGGMSFAHIDRQEIRVTLVIIVDLLDVANLATKWRSSETAEYQY